MSKPPFLQFREINAVLHRPKSSQHKNIDSNKKIDSKTLSDILEQAQSLEYLNKLLQSKLGPEFAKHAVLANWDFKAKTITLLIESATWKFFFKNKSIELLKIIKTIPKFQTITEIKIKINPEFQAYCF